MSPACLQASRCRHPPRWLLPPALLAALLLPLQHCVCVPHL